MAKESPSLYVDSPTRRSFLAFSTGALVSSLAGCSGINGSQPSPSPSTPTTSSPNNSIFTDISFKSQSIVVRLKEDHNVSKVNLIAPDGSLFKQASVVEGATTVRLQILDIKPNIGGYDHYTPGSYELVAVVDDESKPKSIELRPELKISDVQQYKEGEENSDDGNLAISIKNTGTAPTWVYQIVYQDAPNFAANDQLNEKPGVPTLAKPEQPVETIIAPGSTKTFVGSTPPLLFREDNGQRCDGRTFTFQVIAGIPVGDPLRQQVQATVTGEAKSTGMTDQYVCSEATIQLLNQG